MENQTETKVKKNKSETRGRKKVEYNQSELEREPMIMVICGMTEVGKSYQNLKEINLYLKTDLVSGKIGRKVLMFDVNCDEIFEKIPTVKPQHIKNLTNVAPRKILPYNKNGSAMNRDEKVKLVEYMATNYRNGLLVLDDIDKYMAHARGQSIIDSLTTYRHMGRDLLLIHQSIAKITTTEWENATFLRLHYQSDNVDRYRDRIPNFELVKIATLIIEEQYLKAGNERYFLYINTRKRKIIGCSKNTFIRAVKKYLDINSKLIKNLLSYRDENGKQIYTRQSAITELIIEKLMYLPDNIVNSE